MGKFFPLYISLERCRVLVYGGGRIASRRVGVLAQFGASIRIISPEIQPETRYLPAVTYEPGVFDPATMPSADLVLAATSDPAVNHAVAVLCRARGIPVNSASYQADCDFQFPAVAIQGPLVAGVNAGGLDHALVRRAAAAIRRTLEELA